MFIVFHVVRNRRGLSKMGLKEWLMNKSKDKVFKLFLGDYKKLAKENKTINFFINTLPNALIPILLFLAMLFVLNRVHNRYGIDSVVILGLTIIIFSLRGIGKGISDLVKIQKHS